MRQESSGYVPKAFWKQTLQHEDTQQLHLAASRAELCAAALQGLFHSWQRVRWSCWSG